MVEVGRAVHQAGKAVARSTVVEEHREPHPDRRKGVSAEALRDRRREAERQWNRLHVTRAPVEKAHDADAKPDDG